MNNMHTTRWIGYILYTCMALFIIKLLIPVGDHSFGMAQGILILLFGSIITFLFLISLSKSIYRIAKKQGKFHWYPIIVFLITCILVVLVEKADYGKFWTSVRLEGTTDYKQYSKDGRLVLFNNGTFEASVIHVDYGEVYEGDYKIAHDTLTLLRPDLIKITEDIFCNQYKIDTIHQRFIPLKKGFSDIEIQKSTE